MSRVDDFLVEIGTEELPPKALQSLMTAFAEKLGEKLDEARLEHGALDAYASPRRLAVLVHDLALQQEDRDVEQKGPPLRIAFDDDGNATAAAEAFAKKCGVGVADLERQQTDKGEWLCYRSSVAGKTASELVPECIESALSALPIPRRMRWGAHEVEFVRPVHWVLLLHGKHGIDANILGIGSGNTTRGHRFHSDTAITIASPDEYLRKLENDGYVIADFERRRDMVRESVESAAAAAGGAVADGESLYDEVAALVEWPVPVVGNFDPEFLQLPREAIVSTLTGHQRYFPVVDASGALLPKFITVANLESRDPDQVRDGNERVVKPRLADAAFFWDSDRRVTLASRRDALRDVVYQQGLGSLFDKSERAAELAAWVAKAIDADPGTARRAAEIAKCDLLTGMVGEFPELQGTMGRYYANSDGEPGDVATAIGEQYLPRFAGDELPATAAGQALAIADKIDTLAGIFAIGKKPSGNRDPFGLRRAALGIVRILVERALDIDLRQLIDKAVTAQTQRRENEDELAADLYTFIGDRLRRYFLDRDQGLAPETLDAVMVRQPASLVDFDRRLAAVQTFARLDQASSLAAANKRIANILRKAGDPGGLKIKKKLLSEDAEKALFDALGSAQDKVQPLLAAGNYAAVLNELAALREPVDRFFDDVMVMADDAAVRDNRLALLSELRGMFLDVADISRLSIG